MRDTIKSKWKVQNYNFQNISVRKKWIWKIYFDKHKCKEWLEMMEQDIETASNRPSAIDDDFLFNIRWKEKLLNVV